MKQAFFESLVSGRGLLTGVCVWKSEAKESDVVA
jgi:hypothetical protein